MSKLVCGFYSLIGWFGKFIPQLLLRFLVAWHFWDSGLAKFHNQVQSVPEQNAMPFMLAGNASFSVIMWVELACAIMILIGFSTRIAALVLLVLLAGTFMSYMPLEYGSVVELWHTIDTQIPAFKFNLALLLILLTLFFIGAGGLSADGMFRLTSCKSKKQRLAEKTRQSTTRAEKGAKNAEKDAKHAEDEAKKAKFKAEDAEKRAKASETKSKELEEKLDKVEKRISQAESDSKNS